MTESELENLTIAESSERIKSGELSPVELTDLFLQRIARLNPSVNAYTTVLADLARAEAKIAEQEIRSGNYRSVLHGIPISIKDNLATIGVPTTGGSKILADWKPDFDATVVEKLKAAGVITLGKTNMHEWALGGTFFWHHAQSLGSSAGARWIERRFCRRRRGGDVLGIDRYR